MSPGAATTDLAGTVLGGAYRLTQLVGEGGMGWVYEAIQLRLNKRVAVKLMARELASNPEALARFHREASVASHLGHPHLVSVIDFGATDAGAPYLVMEYLDGEDLDHRIRRVGRLPLEAAVEVTKQVASALAAAHDEGIVHRDLKPANVFLVKVKGEGDFVKVLDFGVSKIKAARTRLTRATSVIGTPEYMSPEQATGLIEEIDHRADQWALACIAWEMLSGHAPFIADDMGALFYQIINMDPHPLSRRAPGLPSGVEPVLRRALAKRAQDRFPSIKDFSLALEIAATGRPRELTPMPVEMPRPSTVKETVGYGEAVAPTASCDWNAKTEADQPPAIVPEELIATRRADLDEVPIYPWWRRLKPLHYAVAGAVVLLLVTLLLLWPSMPPPPVAVPPPPARAPRLPEVVTLPTPPPAPEPVLAPVPAVPPRERKPRAVKSSTLDDLIESATSKKGADRMKPSPFAGPFELDHPRPKAPSPAQEKKPARSRAQPELIEEL